MGVGFASFEIVRSGLTSNERALNVTGHNIANANTLGYVRQQAIFKDSHYENFGQYQLGLGTDIEQIRQIRNAFLDNVYRQENTTLGYWEARNKTIQDVQTILGEPMGTGLQNVMNQFWDSWQELSKSPDSLTARALVRQRGDSLVQLTNQMGNQLDKLQNDLNSEISVRIGEINDITDKISNMNILIMKNEITSDSANDYRDQRNVLIDRLSKLANVEVNEMQDGQVSITLGGYFLVNKGISTGLYAGESKTGGLFFAPKLEGTDIEVPVRNGELKGLMEARGEVLGSKGSLENGTPNTKADVVFAIDVSNTSAAYLADVKANIEESVKLLKNKNIDYNLRLITYGNGVISNADFGTDAAALSSAIPSSPVGDIDNNFDGVGGVPGVVSALEGITDFRENANKYTVLFTGESINGDAVAAVTDATSLISRLNNIGMKTSVVTDQNYFEAGDPATNPGAEAGWEAITDGTGGRVYDIYSADYQSMMETIGNDIGTDVNYTMTEVQDSTNILSNLKKQLNALISVMAREVNSLQRSGVTMGIPSNQGDDFFTVIDSTLPIQMGNIKLNDNLANLNNIVTSKSGLSGDSSVALKIANMRHDPLMRDETGIMSIDDYYQSIILSIGNIGSESDKTTENQAKLVQSSDDYRQSISGVSMDEEMSNMLKFKFAYSASSKAINVIDEMLQTVISRMGISGR
jgi:flagellar hook-associated protein 1 FlgK